MKGINFTLKPTGLYGTLGAGVLLALGCFFIMFQRIVINFHTDQNSHVEEKDSDFCGLFVISL